MGMDPLAPVKAIFSSDTYSVGQLSVFAVTMKKSQFIVVVPNLKNYVLANSILHLKDSGFPHL